MIATDSGRKVVAVDDLVPFGRSAREMNANAYAHRGDTLTVLNEDPFSNATCFEVQGALRPEPFIVRRDAVRSIEG
jgi:hypothetical protein